MTETEKNELLEELFRKKMTPGLSVFMTYHMDATEMVCPSLEQLLSIDASELTVTGKKILEYLENYEKDEGALFSFEKFKWKLHAFISIQDVLLCPYYNGTSWNTILQLHYFYYESKYILHESIIASLNGLHVGNNQLLRLFIEFNLLQLYYINKGIKDNSYAGFNEYLKTGIKPSNTALIGTAVPPDTFCKPIRKKIQWELNQLSNRFNHPYTNNDSPKAQGVFAPQASLDSVHFYVRASAILDAVLWMYYVNLPMIFFPVDIFKKFGFNQPTYVFATPSLNSIIRKSLPEQDYLMFEAYAKENEQAEGHIKWYHSHPDLNDEQIWQTSDGRREPGDTILSYYIKQMVEFRAKSEMIVEAIRMRLEQTQAQTTLDDDAIEAYVHFSKWKDVYSLI